VFFTGSEWVHRFRAGNRYFILKWETSKQRKRNSIEKHCGGEDSRKDDHNFSECLDSTVERLMDRMDNETNIIPAFQINQGY
jgi:hypothetical protein